jgi:trans-2,3-dihydro-3-hydroxyanthranilate isomerase
VPKIYKFLTVDVFTDRPFTGNPLAVFPDARGLTKKQMQQIAREFNYSETTFVLPPKKKTHTAQVRIFTPKDEIPFAGHPNVGTAFALSPKYPRVKTLLFEEGAGLVPVEILRGGNGRVTGAMLTAPQPLSIGDKIPADAVASCLSLEPGSVVTARHEPVVVSVGLPFVVAEVTADGLARAKANLQAFEKAAESYPTKSLRFSIFFYARSSDTQMRSRMFAPLSGVPEDPATGSANCALVGLLAQLSPQQDMTLKLDVWQGVEMGRASRLTDIAEKRGGAVTRIRVGGKCALIMEGRVVL